MTSTSTWLPVLTQTAGVTPSLAQQIEHRATDGAALTDVGDPADAVQVERAGGVGEAGDRPRRHVDDALTVGTEHPHPRAGGDVPDGVLERDSFGADLGEARRVHDRGTCAGVRGVGR